MKVMKQPVVLLSALAMLASCGGSAPAESSRPTGLSTPAASSQPATTSSAAAQTSSAAVSSAADFPDNVTISFWSTGSQGMNDQITELAEEFENAVKVNLNRTVKVNLTVEGGYDDIERKLITGLADGTLPNMAVAYPDTVANIIGQEPAGKQYVYDIDPYMDSPVYGFSTQGWLGDTRQAKKTDIVPAFLDEGTHYSRSGTYSYPFMKSSEVMFYNKDYVEAAYRFYKPEVTGADNIHKDLAAMDWGEFENLLTVVMDHKDDINDQLEYAAFYDSDSNWFISQMYQSGTPYTSIKDGKGSIDFQDGDARKATEDMLDGFKALYADKRINTKGLTNQYGSNFFKDEKILFSIGSSGGTGYQMPPGLDPSDIDIVPVPAVDGNLSYVSQGPTITFIKNPTQSDAVNDAQMLYSWMFAKFLTNTENNALLCVRGSQGYVPIRYSSYETETFIDTLTANTLYAKSGTVMIQEIAGHYYNAPVFKGSAELRDLVGAAAVSVMKNEKTAKQALKDAIDTALNAMAD